ncbi:MAG: hypothetical protein HYV99_02190 [Betaproteobacteria bacterium]|nr:hypothetical protein [Betaproteobacteria bacterium]
MTNRTSRPPATGRRSLVTGLCALICALSGAQHAQAQAYPVKPVRIITGFAGGSDLMARLVAQQLSPALGQQVFVEQRLGAAGSIGFEAAAKSPPDGYTLLLGAITLVTNPFIHRRIGYDPIKDFAPIMLRATGAQVPRQDRLRLRRRRLREPSRRRVPAVARRHQVHACPVQKRDAGTGRGHERRRGHGHHRRFERRAVREGWKNARAGGAGQETLGHDAGGPDRGRGRRPGTRGRELVRAARARRHAARHRRPAVRRDGESHVSGGDPVPLAGDGRGTGVGDTRADRGIHPCRIRALEQGDSRSGNQIRVSREVVRRPVSLPLVAAPPAPGRPGPQRAGGAPPCGPICVSVA